MVLQVEHTVQRYKSYCQRQWKGIQHSNNWTFIIHAGYKKSAQQWARILYIKMHLVTNDTNVHSVREFKIKSKEIFSTKILHFANSENKFFQTVTSKHPRTSKTLHMYLGQWHKGVRYVHFSYKIFWPGLKFPFMVYCLTLIIHHGLNFLQHPVFHWSCHRLWGVACSISVL